ncbi:MAG: exosortase A, partial [Gammaproteobacteria bacterium]|nr:exosortase A [Gammaproteobacteria bacterium]
MTTNTDIRGLRVPLLLAALVVIAVIVMLSETFGAMVRIWTTTQAFNHCMLIPPASLYLIWLQRKKLGYIQAEATPAVLLLVTGVVVAWVLGELANALVVQSFAAVALLILAIWAMIGTRAAYAIMFPLGYLFFMVPFGEFLIPPLMEYTADFTVAAVRISGVPIYRSGLFLQIPEGAFKVVEACSGVRMLIAALAVGALIAYLNFDLWLRRLAFIAGAAVLALAANGIRAYVVVMMAYFNGMDSVEDHNDIGYLIFGIVIVVLLLIGRWLSDEVTDVKPDVTPAVKPYSGLGVALGVVALALIAPLSAGIFLERVQAAPSASLLPMPAGGDIWSGPQLVDIDWRPAVVGDPFIEFGQYRNDAARI